MEGYIKARSTTITFHKWKFFIKQKHTEKNEAALHPHALSIAKGRLLFLPLFIWISFQFLLKHTPKNLWRSLTGKVTIQLLLEVTNSLRVNKIYFIISEKSSRTTLLQFKTSTRLLVSLPLTGNVFCFLTVSGVV